MSKKGKSTIYQHLFWAIVLTIIFLCGVVRISGKKIGDLGDVAPSYSSSSLGRPAYIVVDAICPLIAALFGAVFAWMGFAEDYRALRRERELPACDHHKTRQKEHHSDSTD
jgi:hypothetical protein